MIPIACCEKIKSGKIYLYYQPFVYKSIEILKKDMQLKYIESGVQMEEWNPDIDFLYELTEEEVIRHIIAEQI